jgi:hypothetical protein
MNNKFIFVAFKLQFFLQVIKPFVICMMMMFFLQMSGFNVMVFYCVTIFHKSGSTIQPNLASIIGRSFYYKKKIFEYMISLKVPYLVGSVLVLSCFVALGVVSRLGRSVIIPLNIYKIYKILN